MIYVFAVIFVLFNESLLNKSIYFIKNNNIEKILLTPDVLIVMYICVYVYVFVCVLAALDDVCELEAALRPGLEEIENYQKLLELQKDLIGVEHLAVAGRQLIRLGCLSKLSGKGLQQRMFFLVRFQYTHLCFI